LTKKHEQEIKSNTKKHTEKGEYDQKRLEETLSNQCKNEKLLVEDKASAAYDKKFMMHFTSWKLQCKDQLKEQMSELNSKCVKETKIATNTLKREHKRTEEQLKAKLNDVLKDLKREEERLVKTIKALRLANDNEYDF